MQQANFSYSTDYESPNSNNQFIIVDIIEDASSSTTTGFNNYTKSQLNELSSAHHQINHRQEKQDKMHTTNDKASHDDSESDCIIGENIEMEASLVDLSGISSQTTCNNITSICQDNTKSEKVMTCEQQPDITPPTTDTNTQQQDAMKDVKNLTSIVEPIHIEAFSVEPSYSRGESNNLSSPKLKSNEIRLEPLIEIPKHHHPLSFYSNSSHSSSSNTTTSGEEDTFYTLDCSLSNLNHHEEHSISSTPKQENSKQILEFNSTLHLLQSLRDEQSKTQLASLHSFNTPIHVENLLGSNNFSSDATLKNPISLQFEKNSKTPNQELVLNHSHHRKMMRFLNITAFAVLDISFVIGAALFVAGCGLLIANNVTYFFSGILLFIIGSVLFLVGPLGKTLVDLINLIRHFRWEKKVKQVTNLQSESSKTLKDQMHELHQDITSYRPGDLPPLKMIILELVNDFFLIIGGLTFTIGSSLYMLNPPMLIVIIAEVNWSVGAVSYLIVSIIQYIVKQVDIIKSARNGMDINVKCFTFMSIDLSAYLLNIASSLLFTIGSGCFLVNERTLEITGEVIWSLGCVAMIIAVVCNRIIWIKSTWFERQNSSINV